MHIIEIWFNLFNVETLVQQTVVITQQQRPSNRLEKVYTKLLQVWISMAVTQFEYSTEGRCGAGEYYGKVYVLPFFPAFIVHERQPCEAGRDCEK
jgi:hypothetical protein